MEQVAAPSIAARVFEFYKGLDTTLRAVLIGAVIVLVTIFTVARSSEAVARVTALEHKVEAQQSTLERIEEKLDRLILKLIP